MERRSFNDPTIKHVEGERLYGSDCLTRRENHHSFRYECRIVNFSSHKVYAAQRNGFVLEVDPADNNHHLDCIVVCHEVVNGRSPMTFGDGRDDPLRDELHHELVKDNKRVYWEEKIDIKTIYQASNGVYLRHSDLMVFTSRQAALVINHPHCSQKIRNDYTKAYRDYDQDAMIDVGIRLIDNEGLLSKQYIVFHDRILTLTPVIDPEQDSGFYVSGLTELISASQTTCREDQWFSFEDAKSGKAPFTLHDSMTAARAAMQEPQIKEKEMQQQHEARLQELKRENDLAQREWEREKIELQREKATWEHMAKEKQHSMDSEKHFREHHFDKEKLEMEKELARIKAEMDRMKADADHRAQRNKLLTEETKTIGLIITLGFLIYKTLNNESQ